MIDYYIEDYGRACAQKQKAKDYLRHQINEAHNRRKCPLLYEDSFLNIHWYLNYANDWVAVIQRYDRSIKLKKQDIIDYVAQMEPYEDVA